MVRNQQVEESYKKWNNRLSIEWYTYRSRPGRKPFNLGKYKIADFPLPASCGSGSSSAGTFLSTRGHTKEKGLGATDQIRDMRSLNNTKELRNKNFLVEKAPKSPTSL